jgi:integrase
MTLIESMVLQPLEQLLLPTALDGSQGINRELTKTCYLSATNDIEAIQQWLAEYQHRSETYRHYRKDAERLLLWSLFQLKKPLSSLSREDILVYSQFLDNPQPADVWCGPKKARNGKRWTSGWRPFVGSLGKNAKATTFANLASLFNFLVDNQYLATNPMRAVRNQIKYQHGFEEHQLRVGERSFDSDECQVIYAALEEMPEKKESDQWHKERLRFLFSLFYFTCPRVNEVVKHTMAAFKKMHDPKFGKDRWWLRIRGKGGKLITKPVNTALLTALIRYRRFLKFADLPESQEDEPLIRSHSTGTGISARRINQLMKDLFEKAAQKLDSTQPEKAQHLRRGSPHWLRHTSLTMQAEADIKKQHRKDNAGHANDQTAEIYEHSQDRARHQAMENLVWPPVVFNIALNID